MADRKRDLTSDYTPRAVAACEKALRSVLTRIGGTWRERVAVVGGMVPRYLYPEADTPEEVAPHIGTTDVDIGVGLLVGDADDAVYTALEEAITELGFRQTERDNNWRWARDVDGVNVLLEFLGPIESDQSHDDGGTQSERPIGGSGNLHALAVKGIELVPRDCIEVLLDGPLLDSDGERKVTAQFANLLPFLMLKANAFEDRGKHKDSYDIVWALLAHSDGPGGAAHDVADSPIADHEYVEEAIGHLRTLYATYEKTGPMTYAAFEISRRGDDPSPDLRARLARDAHGAVQAFLAEWDAVRGTG